MVVLPLPPDRLVWLLRHSTGGERQWHTWYYRFEVLDTNGAVVAECRPQRVFRPRYIVRMRDGRLLIDLRSGAWRAFNGAKPTWPVVAGWPSGR